jgi:predicted membrane-bound spermidine synthase
MQSVHVIAATAFSALSCTVTYTLGVIPAVIALLVGTGVGLVGVMTQRRTAERHWQQWSDQAITDDVLADVLEVWCIEHPGP